MGENPGTPVKTKIVDLKKRDTRPVKYGANGCGPFQILGNNYRILHRETATYPRSAATFEIGKRVIVNLTDVAFRIQDCFADRWFPPEHVGQLGLVISFYLSSDRQQ